MGASTTAVKKGRLIPWKSRAERGISNGSAPTHLINRHRPENLNSDLFPPLAANNPNSFHLRINGREVGPLDRKQVRDLFAQKKVGRTTPCRLANSNEWLSVYDLVPSAIWGAESSTSTFQQAETQDTKPSTFRRTAYLSLAAICGIGALLLFFALVGAIIPSGPLTPRHSPRSNGVLAAGSLGAEPSGDGIEALASIIAAVITLGYLGILASFVIGIILSAFWVWMLSHAATKEPPGPDKITWVLIIVLTGPIGATIYFFARFLARPSNAPPPLPQSHPRIF